MKVLFGSFVGAGRVLNFYEGSCVGPDTVVGVDVADAFHQVIDVLDALCILSPHVLGSLSLWLLNARSVRGPCVRKLLTGLIMYIYPLKIKNIVLY